MICRLPEIDLARIAPSPASGREYELRAFSLGHPPLTYKPVRDNIGDLLNLNSELLGPQPVTHWEIIKRIIAKASRDDLEQTCNIAVAKAIYDFAIETRAVSFKKDTARWNVGFGQSVVYWSNLYTVIDGRPHFIFFDQRLSNCLQPIGRRFVFSMMHQRLRVDDPDFSTAELCIMQFRRGDLGQRVMKPYYAQYETLYSRDELNLMIDETYRLWMDICAERERETRSKAVGQNPMKV